MATEGPLLHDGSQCVAAANYSNSAGLSGPSGSGQFLAVVLTSAGRTVAVASSAGAQCYGILQNKPTSGAAADVGFLGPTKAVAGGTIAAGAPVMTNASGAIVAWTAGSAYAQIGYAIEAAASGQIFTMYFGPTSPKVLT